MDIRMISRTTTMYSVEVKPNANDDWQPAGDYMHIQEAQAGQREVPSTSQSRIVKVERTFWPREERAETKRTYSFDGHTWVTTEELSTIRSAMENVFRARLLLEEARKDYMAADMQPDDLEAAEQSLCNLWHMTNAITEVN